MTRIELIFLSFIAIFVLLFTITPRYRVMHYETKTIGTMYGFEGKTWIFGKWNVIGFGAKSKEDAYWWIKNQKGLKFIEKPRAECAHISRVVR
ncbi:MAG: hypothetical protein ABFC94_15730 [Syntrophomonas sp.]